MRAIDRPTACLGHLSTRAASADDAHARPARVGLCAVGAGKDSGTAVHDAACHGPRRLFLCRFFSATGFYQFIGVAQWVAAACLLMPRTATLGALLYLPIVVNVFVVTVAIGQAFAFTRVVTGALLLGSVYLLLWDWDRWKQILPTSAPHDRRHGELLTVIGMLVSAGVGLQGLVALNTSRVRGTSSVVPLMTVAIAATVAGVVVMRAYRTARVVSTDAALSSPSA
jgi:hypothetical protein